MSDEGTRKTTHTFSAQCVKGIDHGPEASIVVEKKQEGVFAKVFGLLGPTPRRELWRRPPHLHLCNQELSLVVRVPRGQSSPTWTFVRMCSSASSGSFPTAFSCHRKARR